MRFTAMQATRLEVANKLREARKLLIDCESSIVWGNATPLLSDPGPVENANRHLVEAEKHIAILLNYLIPNNSVQVRKED